MSDIDSHIARDRAELEEARATGNEGKARHLEEELSGLEEYRTLHPDEVKDPSPLEVYCELNPSAPECRVYDD